MNDNYNDLFMMRAIELSEQAYESGHGLPIGCVIVKDGIIIGEGHNEIFVRNNPTAHAEMVAIENACKNSQELQLSDCEMYTTLEPCPMCFGAIYWAKLKTVFYANNNVDASEIGFDDSFIFNELLKPDSEKRIPLKHVQNLKAKNVLHEWCKRNINPSQPWSHLNKEE